MNQMFADLSAAGIEVSSLRNKQNRLEQLFVEMVANKGDVCEGGVNE